MPGRRGQTQVVMSTGEGSAITKTSQAVDSLITKSLWWTVDVTCKEANSLPVRFVTTL